MAEKAVRAVVIRPDGAKSGIPAAAMAALESELRGRVEERVIFEHLCVMWWRVKEGGLALAAKQLLALASIGLKPAELDAAMARSEGMRGAAKSIQSKATAGATVASPRASGVGFRPAPKKKT